MNDKNCFVSANAWEFEGGGSNVLIVVIGKGDESLIPRFGFLSMQR